MINVFSTMRHSRHWTITDLQSVFVSISYTTSEKKINQDKPLKKNKQHGKRTYKKNRRLSCLSCR